MATISVGDHVLVYSSRDSIDSITVKSGVEFQSRFGHFRHDDMVGKAFGSKFPSSNGRGFVYLLRPTPELWTLALPHRTQILYLPDIAFITSFLDIKAGSKVIEAGTGSGSFSHSIARSVGSKGKIFSFEYHEERYGKAKEEFAQHGLDDIITLKHQNVCKDGFEIVDKVDSVFLDVPAPWEAIGHAKIALRKDRQSRICCFSPCIEQVIRTVTALSEAGFSDITMYETLTRSHDPAPLHAPPISAAIERIHEVEVKKEKRRLGQIQDAQDKRSVKELDKKRKRDAEVAAEGELSEEPSKKKIALDRVEAMDGGEVVSSEDQDDADMSETTGGETTGRLPRLAELMDDSPSTSTAASPEPTSLLTNISADSDSASVKVSKTATGKSKQPPNPPNPPRRPLPIKTYTFKAGPQSRGHTSYLTFATLLPSTTLREKELEKAKEALIDLENGKNVVVEVGKAGTLDADDEFPLEEGDLEMIEGLTE